ncbi:MAG TPA: hypothetical protein EYP14_00425 [Planctomycetaceae bacterium]|nr:hypothetical protein [Planctomycetaceae bacterium]
MESTFHRQLKQRYSGPDGPQEVAVAGYRIDAVQNDWLIEIQTGSLAAIKNKVRDLLREHRVLVVKPLVVRKFLVKWSGPKGDVVSSRYSPLRGHVHEVFEELVYIVALFPHPRLALEIVLVEQEEHRIPAPRRSRGYRVADRRLRKVFESIRLEQAEDLVRLLPDGLRQRASREPVTTLEIADEMVIPRWLAQKVGYCLRKTGAARVVGRKGSALMYAIDSAARRAA